MMLTAAGAVDSAAAIVSVTELAQMKGVSKQAISKRLARFESENLIAVARRGREKVVSLADWDRVAHETTDPAKLQGRATKAAIAGNPVGSLDDEIDRVLAGGTDAKKDPTYSRELTRKAGFEADLKEMEIRRQRGALVEIDDVRAAMERCAEAMVRDIDQLPAFADDIAAAVSRGGAPAAREVLKVKARELRDRLARSMTLLGGDDEDEEEEMAA